MLHRTHGQQQAPYSRDLDPRRRTPNAASSRRFLTSRTRLHPILLIPVFLCGAFLAPWLSEHVVGFRSAAASNRDALPEPVYHPPDRDWTPQKVLAPADAPPLRHEDDYAGAFVPPRRDRTENAQRRVVGGQARAVADWDDDDDIRAAAAAGSPDSSSPYLLHAGLLYFRTSPSLIREHALERSFPVAPAVAGRPRGFQPPQPPDSGLTEPPSSPRDWLVPGELFVHPPGRRKYLSPPINAAAAVAAGAAVQKKPAPAAAPLARPPPPAGRQPFVGRQVQQKPQEPMRDERGHVLGPNAAAMARAKKEGRPFVPGTPAELVAKVKAYRQRVQNEIDAKRLKAEEPLIRQRQQELLKQAEADKKKKQAQAAAAMQPGFGLRKVDTDGKAAGAGEAALLWADGDDDDHDDGDEEDEEDSLGAIEDDQALLAAIRALTPAELRDLSPDERQLVAELEAHEQLSGQQRRAQGGGVGWAVKAQKQQQPPVVANAAAAAAAPVPQPQGGVPPPPARRAGWNNAGALQGGGGGGLPVVPVARAQEKV
ncbi:hypothetical protein JCM3774_003291, partial [Rhodotorula dairenensis]